MRIYNLEVQLLCADVDPDLLAGPREIFFYFLYMAFVGRCGRQFKGKGREGEGKGRKGNGREGKGREGLRPQESNLNDETHRGPP